MNVHGAARCPLCAGAGHDLLESLRYEDIRWLYRRVHRLDIPAAIASTIDLHRCHHCQLRFYWPQVGGTPAFYERLQALPWYYSEDKAEYRLASQHIAAGQSVLEIGCGAGSFASYLPPGCVYQGLEYNQAAIEKACRRGLQVELASIEAFAESSRARFDVVCSFQVLEHVASPASFLRAAARTLAPGGLLIIAVPAEDSFMADEVNNVLNMPPHHLTRWTDAAIRSISGIAGLAFVALEHEQVSDANLPALARVRVLRWLRALTGVRTPLLSRMAASLPARAALKALAMPTAKLIGRSGLRPPGHSVVAVYRKAMAAV